MLSDAPILVYIYDLNIHTFDIVTIFYHILQKYEILPPCYMHTLKISTNIHICIVGQQEIFYKINCNIYTLCQGLKFNESK